MGTLFNFGGIFGELSNKHKEVQVLCQRGNFIFQKAGHGLFYTATVRSIRRRRDKLDFVYDCGSKSVSIIDKSIDSYSRNANNLKRKKKIDLLAISHFHSDHVSGLNKLVSVSSIKTVVIPYFHPVERLLISFEEDLQAEEWYLSFLIDPVQWLLSDNKANNVIIIGHNKEKEEREFPENTDDSIGDNLLDGLDDDANLEREYSRNEETEILKEGRVYFKSDNNTAFLSHYSWIMRFYSPHPDRSKIAKIESWIKSSTNTKSSLNEIIKEIVLDKNKRALLKSEYEKEFGSTKHNEMSLTLFHAPIKCCCSSCFTASHNTDHLCYGKGQLLTGDLPLKTEYELAALTTHFGKCLDYTRCVQIPHHGSVNNWNSKLTKILMNCQLWINSAKHGDPLFPSTVVENALRQASRKLLRCTENSSVIL